MLLKDIFFLYFVGVDTIVLCENWIYKKNPIAANGNALFEKDEHFNYFVENIFKK